MLEQDRDNLENWYNQQVNQVYEEIVHCITSIENLSSSEASTSKVAVGVVKSLQGASYLSDFNESRMGKLFDTLKMNSDVEARQDAKREILQSLKSAKKHLKISQIAEANSLLIQLEGAESELGQIHQVHEFFNNEIVFIGHMQELLKVLPNSMESENQVEHQDKTITDYLKCLKELIASYKKLDFFKVFEQNTLPSLQVVISLSCTLNSNEFTTYLQNMVELIPSSQAAPHFFEKCSGVRYADLESYMANPYQQLMRYDIQVNALQKALDREAAAYLEKPYDAIKRFINEVNKDENHVLRLSEDMRRQGEYIRQEGRLKQLLLGSSETKKDTVLRDILSLHFNTPKAGKWSHNSDAYFMACFVKVYDNYFFPFNYLNSCILLFNPSNPNHELIKKALGLDEHRYINPNNFDRFSLDNLYKNTNDPLWLVLKSTIPNGLEARINTYIDLAKKVALGEIWSEGKYKVVADIMLSAYSLVQDFDNDRLKRLVLDNFGSEAITKHPDSKYKKKTYYGWVLGKLATSSTEYREIFEAERAIRRSVGWYSLENEQTFLQEQLGNSDIFLEGSGGNIEVIVSETLFRELNGFLPNIHLTNYSKHPVKLFTNSNEVESGSFYISKSSGGLDYSYLKEDDDQPFVYSVDLSNEFLSEWEIDVPEELDETFLHENAQKLSNLIVLQERLEKFYKATYNETQFYLFLAGINAYLLDKQEHSAAALFRELLTQAHLELQNSQTSPDSIRIVMTRFNDLGRSLIRGESPNLNDFANDLNRALYGKPSMSPKMRALVGAIVGVLVGLVIGACISALMMGFDGGFIGFLTAAAVHSFTATAITATSAIVPTLVVASTCASASIGFFHKSNYEKKKEAMQLEHGELLDRGLAIINDLNNTQKPSVREESRDYRQEDEQRLLRTSSSHESLLTP